jgi:hypothetical protein
MRYYCTFFLRSDAEDAPSKVFLPEAIEALDFQDNQSPERLASAQRMRAVGFVPRSDLPRFVWYLDSREEVEETDFDVFTHVSWILSQLRPGVSLADAREQGIESSLGFFWSGNGTGGGPFISLQLAELLVKHQIALDVGFYYAEYESGTTAA